MFWTNGNSRCSYVVTVHHRLSIYTWFDWMTQPPGIVSQWLGQNLLTVCNVSVQIFVQDLRRRLAEYSMMSMITTGERGGGAAAGIVSIEAKFKLFVPDVSHWLLANACFVFSSLSPCPGLKVGTYMYVLCTVLGTQHIRQYKKPACQPRFSHASPNSVCVVTIFQ